MGCWLFWFQDGLGYNSDVNPNAYKINLTALGNGAFSVTVPALPGCVTWGTNLDHALCMAQEAIELWLEVLVEPASSFVPASE